MNAPKICPTDMTDKHFWESQAAKPSSSDKPEISVCFVGTHFHFYPQSECIARDARPFFRSPQPYKPPLSQGVTNRLRWPGVGNEETVVPPWRIFRDDFFSFMCPSRDAEGPVR